MDRIKNPNLEMLMIAVDMLGELADEMVFVGGCATGLLISDNAAPPIRITFDVDAIVQIISLAEYYQLSEKLRARGFKEDVSEGAPLCRWVNKKIFLDVMPTHKEVLGFGNDWYQAALERCEHKTLAGGKNIRVLSAPYFLITKFAAFDDRGKGDYMASHDMEDIVSVLDGRPELVSELQASTNELKKELSARFKILLQTRKFLDSLPGHISKEEGSDRLSRLKNTINKIAAIN